LAIQRKAAAPAVEGFNFGDLNNYSGGFELAPGKYIWTDLTVRMHKWEKSKDPARLGVVVTLAPLTDPDNPLPDPLFYSFGSSADKSFVPSENGKGIVPIPGAPASRLNNQTNWMVMLQSLYNSGLPQGILSNDFSVLEGVWVNMDNVDEPEESKGFQSATAEVATARQSKRIAVVTEILDGGRPWEGGGGYPTGKPAAKANGAPAKVAPKATAKPAPAPESTEGAVDVRQAALDGMNSVMEKNLKGCSSSMLRTGTYAAVKSASDETTADAVISEIFDAGEASINELLAVVGYRVAAGQVKPV